MVIKRIGVVLLTVLLCLVMLEIGLRAVGRRPTNMADGIYEQDGDSFRLKRNATKLIRYPAFSYTVYTDEYGFRDRATGPRDLRGKPFYAVLGASEVFGNGADYDETFVGIFAKAAQAKGLEVLNLATGGHNFIDQERLLRRFMDETGLKPAAVLFCANALHLPTFDQKIENVIVKNGYVIDRSGWRTTYIRLMAGNLSSAFCFFRDGVRKIQEKWLHQTRSSKSTEFLDAFSKSNPIRSPARRRELEDYLGRFEGFCRQNGIEPIYVFLPLSDTFRLNEILKQIGADPGAFDATFYETFMRSYCDGKGARLVDLSPVLEQAFRGGQEIRFKLDPHFNLFANRLIGEFLARQLL
jgi:hypothetical protein